MFTLPGSSIPHSKVDKQAQQGYDRLMNNKNPTVFEEIPKKGLFGKTMWSVSCSEHSSLVVYKTQEEAVEAFYGHVRTHPHFHMSVALDKKAGTTQEESPFVDFDSARSRAQAVAQGMPGLKVEYRGTELTTGMDLYQIQLLQGKITTLVTAYGCLGC